MEGGGAKRGPLQRRRRAAFTARPDGGMIPRPAHCARQF